MRLWRSYWGTSCMSCCWKGSTQRRHKYHWGTVCTKTTRCYLCTCRPDKSDIQRCTEIHHSSTFLQGSWHTFRQACHIVLLHTLLCTPLRRCCWELNPLLSCIELAEQHHSERSTPLEG